MGSGGENRDRTKTERFLRESAGGKRFITSLKFYSVNKNGDVILSFVSIKYLGKSAVP